MVQANESVVASIRVDTSQATAGLELLTKLSETFAGTLGSALEDMAFRGRSFSEAMNAAALSVARSTLRSSTGALGDALSTGLTSLFKGAAGGGGAPLNITPHAKGGIFDHPTLTSLNGPRLGVIGEAGPEAVLPLTRGSDGRLGVRNEGGGGGGNVTINISTPNVESFRRAETQVAATMARAIDRGRRNQ